MQEDHGRRSGTYVAGRGVVTDVVVEGGKVDVIVEEDVEITTMKPVIEIVTNSSKLPKSIEIIVQDVRLEEELQTNEIVQAEGKQNINLEDEDHSIVSNDEAFVNEILEDNTYPDKNEEKPVVDTTEQYIEITTILP